MRHWVTPMNVLTTPDGMRGAAIKYGDHDVWVICTDGGGYQITAATPWLGVRTYCSNELRAMLDGDGQAAGNETVPLEDWLHHRAALATWTRRLDAAVPEIGTPDPIYHVTWEIDVFEAESVWSAAAKAWIAMTRTGSIATVFTVTDRATGRVYTVDLTENRVERKD